MKIYVLVGARDHDYYGVFGNMDTLIREVSEQRDRDSEGWRYKLPEYLERNFDVVHAEVQGEVDTSA